MHQQQQFAAAEITPVDHDGRYRHPVILGDRIAVRRPDPDYRILSEDTPAGTVVTIGRHPDRSHPGAAGVCQAGPVPEDLLIARNPDPDSALPYLIRIPLSPRPVVVKARQSWPREKKVFCHREVDWPEQAEILERWPVTSCVRRGPAIDLVLARGRENRSQLVLAQARGREVIFWQSPRTTKQARPAVRVPTARAHGLVLDILVDSAEKYPYTFGAQQATTTRQRLPAGDYAVTIDDEVVAAVERKSLADLASSLLSGKLTYALAELTALPRAAVVVEDRYSQLFKLEHAPGARAAEALAEAQARFPQVPVVFCETRPLAQEWTYRYLGACLAELAVLRHTDGLESSFGAAAPLPPRPATSAEIRSWALRTGLPVSDRGRIPAQLRQAYHLAHPG